MTAHKHTPGPWQVAEKFNCVDVRGVDGPYIANCNQSVAIDWRTKEANARLIAAAPDLYDAVAAVIGATRAYLPPGGITKEEFISRVIAATDNARMAEIMK